MGEADTEDDAWTLADAIDAGEQGWALFPGDKGGHFISVSELGSSLFNDDDEATVFVERMADSGDPLAIKAVRLIQADHVP